MVGGPGAGLGGVEDEGELLADLRLADEVVESFGAQRGFRVALGGFGRARDEAVLFGTGEPLVAEVHLIGLGPPTECLGTLTESLGVPTECLRLSTECLSSA